MRVAICFFGLTRSLRKYTFKSIKKNIFQPLRKNNYEYDVFLHTYNLKQINNPRSREINIELDPVEYKLLRPKSNLIEDQNEIDKTFDFDFYLKNGDPWHDNGLSLKNLLRQLHSLHKVTEILDDYIKKTKVSYDWVIYSRPDLEFYSPIDIFNKKSEDNIIYIPTFASFGGYNDRFAYGSLSTMRIYGNRILSVDSYVNTGKRLHSETFLKFHLTTYKISRKETSIFFRRVRANGRREKH